MAGSFKRYLVSFLLVIILSYTPALAFLIRQATNLKNPSRYHNDAQDHDAVISSSRGVVLLSAGGKGFDSSSKGQSAPKEYPPLSKEEVQQWMGHIPVYAVTDPKGNGHAIQMQNNPKKTAFYFFLSPLMAEAFLKLLPNQEENDLTVSGLFLGKIWYEFNLLQGGAVEDEDDDDDDDDSSTSSVEYRLVPDPRDLMTAQTLLEMEKSGNNKQTIQQQLNIQPYNTIPLFGVNNMPELKNQNQKVKDFLNQMVSSHYMFFSSRNMLDVMDAMKDESQEEDDLIFLHQVVAEMTLTSSSTDYRNTVLVPPTPITDGTVSDAVLAEQFENPQSFVCQRFLLPLLKD